MAIIPGSITVINQGLLEGKTNPKLSKDQICVDKYILFMYVQDQHGFVWNLFITMDLYFVIIKKE